MPMIPNDESWMSHIPGVLTHETKTKKVVNKEESEEDSTNFMGSSSMEMENDNIDVSSRSSSSGSQTAPKSISGLGNFGEEFNPYKKNEDADDHLSYNKMMAKQSHPMNEGFDERPLSSHDDMSTMPSAIATSRLESK